jgi:hypothetical protein
MEQVRTEYLNAVAGTKPEVLHKIHRKEKNIAIYHRDISHLRSDINTCMKGKIEFRKSGSIPEIQAALEVEIPNCYDLIHDIVSLIKVFGELTENSTFKVLLSTVNTNMCRRFHTDINDLRLLCTYSGQGTLWIPEEFVNREALNSCGDNECILRDASQVQQVPTGSVAILKGAIYPKEGTKACVHRSPSIEESGERRLLLRIDTQDLFKFQ